jgi:hypothetical protein
MLRSVANKKSNVALAFFKDQDVLAPDSGSMRSAPPDGSCQC